MTIDMTQNGRLTWNGAGGLTLAVLFMGVLVGVWMMRQRVFLAPPLAASTPYLYMAVGSVPALVTFLVSAWARPMGKRLMLIALPIFGSVIFAIYLVIIGPGFYTDIQCQATSGSGSASHLDCSCWHETIEGKAFVKCSADELSPLPLIRLVEEERGVPRPGAAQPRIALDSLPLHAAQSPRCQAAISSLPTRRTHG